MAQETKTGTRPTLKTIARLSGLAVPTVSRALNDAPDIGYKTKVRVREIAKEIGYRPDRAGLRLRTGKTNVIALVLPTEYDMLTHSARLVTSLAAGTRGTPYQLIVTPYFPEQDPMEPILHVTETRSADGLILNQTMPDDPRTAHLMELGFPFATHGRTNTSDAHPFYDFDNAAFGALCVRWLAERGRRSVVLVAPPRQQFYGTELINGATREAARRGLPFTVLPGATSDDAFAVIDAEMRLYLEARPEVDGIIAASPTAAMAATIAAESTGARMGQSFDLVAKESVPFLNRFRPEILVVQENVNAAGSFLARAIVQAIDAPDKPPMQHLEVPRGETP